MASMQPSEVRPPLWHRKCGRRFALAFPAFSREDAGQRILLVTCQLQVFSGHDRMMTMMRRFAADHWPLKASTMRYSCYK